MSRLGRNDRDLGAYQGASAGVEPQSPIHLPISPIPLSILPIPRLLTVLRVPIVLGLACCCSVLLPTRKVPTPPMLAVATGSRRPPLLEGSNKENQIFVSHNESDLCFVFFYIFIILYN
ncbi:hypothetical protein Dimus_038578 [Dionaea muscipula]